MPHARPPAAPRPRRVLAPHPAAGALALLACVLAAGVRAQQEPSPEAPEGIMRWLNPATSPIIPVPEIDVDPNTGTTLGLIPTYLHDDPQGNIDTIVAPDVIRTQNFGWGARFRTFAYPSDDTQWFLVAGGKERVESEFNARYETGRRRDGPWSWTVQGIYDRSGTERFYGIGNQSKAFDQSVYTNQQLLLRSILGWNITRRWQLAYTFAPRKVKIVSAYLRGVPSTTRRYEGLLGLGTTHEVLHRLSLGFDNRDDLVVPTRGMALLIYGGVAARQGFLNQSLFSEVGADGRAYWSPNPALTVAVHASTRYMPVARHAPFWALSSLGGATSNPGESQTLRGFGTARFYGLDSFSGNIELRQTVFSVDVVGTHIDVQATPFVDAGRVFRFTDTTPVAQLHWVGGLGVRAIARPSVVGYVDVGKGSEGVAVFTGINYPF